jgi:hypothetical protein
MTRVQCLWNSGEALLRCHFYLGDGARATVTNTPSPVVSEGALYGSTIGAADS